MRELCTLHLHKMRMVILEKIYHKHTWDVEQIKVWSTGVFGWNHLKYTTANCPSVVHSCIVGARSEFFRRGNADFIKFQARHRMIFRQWKKYDQEVVSDWSDQQKLGTWRQLFQTHPHKWHPPLPFNQNQFCFNVIKSNTVSDHKSNLITNWPLECGQCRVFFSYLSAIVTIGHSRGNGFLWYAKRLNLIIYKQEVYRSTHLAQNQFESIS